MATLAVVNFHFHFVHSPSCKLFLLYSRQQVPTSFVRRTAHNFWTLELDKTVILNHKVMSVAMVKNPRPTNYTVTSADASRHHFTKLFLIAENMTRRA